MDEIVEKLKDLSDPTTVEQRAASVTELHRGTPINYTRQIEPVTRAILSKKTSPTAEKPTV